MGIINVVNNIPSLTMNIFSSVFSTAHCLISSNGFLTFLSILYTLIAKVIYFTSKWMLYILDIIYAFIQQLCGLNMNYESIDTLVSQESDMVFNLLISATQTITPIVKALIGLSITLIIIFAIIAIVKSQFNSLKKGPTDVKTVLASTLKAFILLFVTPMIAIIGVVASNTILKSLYNATNPSKATTLSTQVFSVATTSANAYRVYGQNGYRIPITFDYSKHLEILEYYNTHEVNNSFREYVESDDNLIFVAYKMFKDNTFDEYDILNDVSSSTSTIIQSNVTSYYTLFDRSNSALGASTNSIEQYKKISSYKTEYFVMADVIDYGILSSQTMYFKTIEEVMNSLANLETNEQFDLFFSMFEIELLDSNLNVIKPKPSAGGSPPVGTVFSEKPDYITIYKSNEWKVIRFSSSYYDVDEISTPSSKMEIEYNHVRGATDELHGAKYIIAVEKEIESSTPNVFQSYFYPLVNDASNFKSDYIQMGQIISAKGIFSDGKYPTAIRKSKDGMEVQFYRHNLKTITLGDLQNAASGSLKSQEVKSGILSFFEKLIALINPDWNFSFQEGKIVTAYTYDEVLVNVIASGKVSLSYMFEDDMTNFLGGVVTGASNVVRTISGRDKAEQIGIFGFKLENLFVANKINMVILLVASFILIKITFAALFALINRSYELFLVIMIYPTACATIPFDDTGYKEWTRTYTQRLFSTYGIILGLNFVLLLFPIIAEIEIFKAGDIAISQPTRRLRNIFSLGGIIPISYEFVAKFLNMIVVLLFELVAFTLLETIPDTIQQIIGKPGAKGSVNPIETLGKMLKVINGVSQTIFGAGKGLLDILMALLPNQKGSQKREEIKDKIKEKTSGFIPGSAIIDAAKDKKFLNDKKKEQKEAKNEMLATLSGAQDGDSQESINKYLETQKAYNKALSNPKAARDEKEREEHKAGLSSRDSEDAKDDNEEDVTYRTKRELKKARKRQQAVVQYLTNKQKSGKVLTKEEKRSLAMNEERLNKTIEALQSKKLDKLSFSERRELAVLERKAKKAGVDDNGIVYNQTLAPEQQERLEELQNKKIELKEKDILDKQKRKEVNKSFRKQQKQEKIEKRILEQQSNMKHIFSHSGIKSRRQQSKFYKDMANDKTAIQKFADENGASKSVEEMSEDELLQLSEKMKFNPILKSKLDRFMLSKKMQGELMQRQEKHLAHQTKISRNKQWLKNEKKAGKRSGLRKISRNLSKEDAKKQELEEIEKQLERLGPINASNNSQYMKLKKRQAEIHGQMQFTKEFKEYNNLGKEELKQRRKAGRIQNKIQSKALDNLIDDSSSLSREKIDKATQEERRKYEKRKAKLDKILHRTKKDE